VLKQDAVTGNTLTEYGLAITLVAVVAIGPLSQLGKTLSGQFGNMLGTPGTLSLLKPSSSSTASNTTGSAATSAAFTPSGATNSINATEILSFQELSKTVETTGANGSTDMLADTMTKLAEEQLAAGLITESTYNQLIALSNQGHKIASVLQAIEAAGTDASITSGNAYWEASIQFNGKSIQIYELYDLIAFDQSYSTGLLKDPLTYKGQPGPEMETFISMYKDIVNSGSLSAATSDQLKALTSQIATLSDAVSFAVDDRAAKDVTAATFTDGIVSRLEGYTPSWTVNQDSTQICGMGNGQDSGTTCTPSG
jgi:Flp pilus assembly pilin Flp